MHVSLSRKIYQVRVNEPTTFNSGLALCLFLSGLLNIKPFFSSHSFIHHFSQFQQRKSFLFPGLMGNISLVLFCWLVSLDEDSAIRPTLCGLLITSRYLIWYIILSQWQTLLICVSRCIDFTWQRFNNLCLTTYLYDIHLQCISVGVEIVHIKGTPSPSTSSGASSSACFLSFMQTGAWSVTISFTLHVHLNMRMKKFANKRWQTEKAK